LVIQELMAKKNITKYRLSKNSGVPYSTISDICSGRARLEKCSAETIYLLVMLDYISRENDVPICAEYDDLRKCRLEEVVYPSSVLVVAEVSGNSDIKERG